MIKKFTLDPKTFFTILATTKRSQAATMVLAPQSSTGSLDNKHPESDQWLFVLSGQANVIVENETIQLQQGELILIEAGKTHEIINQSQTELKILNIYALPAY